MVRHPGAEALQSGRPKKWLESPEGWAKANLIYEKTVHLPPEGSLREALLLTVWLRRQELKVHETKILTVGLAEMITKAGSAKNTVEAFTEYLNSAFPFIKKSKDSQNANLIAQMQKEVSKGVVTFQALPQNPLREAARKRQGGDQTLKSLKNGRTVVDFRRKVME